jgi:hypothetical protein
MRKFRKVLIKRRLKIYLKSHNNRKLVCTRLQRKFVFKHVRAYALKYYWKRRRRRSLRRRRARQTFGNIFRTKPRWRARRKKTIKLGPSKVLHKRNFYRPTKNKGLKGCHIENWPYIIKATSSALMTPKKLEISRRVVSRALKKLSALIIM